MKANSDGVVVDGLVVDEILLVWVKGEVVGLDVDEPDVTTGEGLDELGPGTGLLVVVGKVAHSLLHSPVSWQRTFPSGQSSLRALPPFRTKWLRLQPVFLTSTY